MIVRRKIFEKYEGYHFNLPYKTGDKVLVKKGDVLKEGSEIMVSKASSVKHSFYLPDKIGVEVSKAGSVINCIDGELVNKGDILAQKTVSSGLNVRKLLSPIEGVVDLSRIEKGYLNILGEETEVVIKSTFDGVVEGINPVDGINILSTSYSLDVLSISDMEINSGNRMIGEFVVLGEANNLLIEATEESYEDKIVFVGKYLHPNLLHDLFQKGALFVLTYSMEYSDFAKQGLPVGVVGGFGAIHSANEIIELISCMNGKFAVLDYSESQIFFVTNDMKYESREDLFVRSVVGSSVISRSIRNYGMLGKVLSVDDSSYITVGWESGQKSMVGIGSVEFVSF